MNNDGLHDPGRVVLSSDGTHEGAGAGETRGVCESPPSPMPSRYATIVADPPWPYPDGFASFDRSRKPLPYDAMTLEDIKALRRRCLDGCSAGEVPGGAASVSDSAARIYEEPEIEVSAVRVGRGRAVHRGRLWRRRPFLRTDCGYFGHEGYITRCALEPVTCKACLKQEVLNAAS